ncbi:lipocalin family protein [Spongiimicrobium sp. 3-5]|uniref:lipocalin family protein n=1 Tax=Spongiimicrobium sp. 3-5 TaxID=3332596 RepID=UPI0039800EB5
MILGTVSALCTLFISCKSDDDGSDLDPIIGKWQVEQEFSNGVSENIPACEKEGYWEFSADGKYKGMDIRQGSTGTCGSDPFSGDWRNAGNNIYIIISDFDPSEQIEEERNITFSNGKMTITYDNNFTSVYVKVN